MGEQGAPALGRQGLWPGRAAGEGEDGSVKHVSAAANPALRLDRLSKLLIAGDII